MDVQEDFIEFIKLMVKNEIEFMVIGAHALGFYGLPRATGDFDFWIRQTKQNAEKILNVINEYFGSSLGLSSEDFLDDETIQFGVQPVRIDLIKKISGVDNKELWENKIKGKFADLDLYFISKELFIKNKKAIGRPKDLADAQILIDYDNRNS